MHTWWIIGWATGFFVTCLAATLLLTIIGYARRIVRQAGEIVQALDGARANTEPLFDVATINYSLERITRGLAELRNPQLAERDAPVPKGVLGRVRERFENR